MEDIIGELLTGAGGGGAVAAVLWSKLTSLQKDIEFLKDEKKNTSRKLDAIESDIKNHLSKK